MDALSSELRVRLDRAVERCVRRGHGTVASHLSAGRDSSAVSVSAASCLIKNNQQLFAFTAAPREPYQEHIFVGWSIDEAALAAITADRSPNINHEVIRPTGANPFERLLQVHSCNPYPVGHLSNFHWWVQIMDAAQARGASIMLTGQAGNQALSAGGLIHFPDMLAEGKPRLWWQKARHVAKNSPSEWLKIIHASIGPFLPWPLYWLARKITGRASSRSVSNIELVRSRYRPVVERAMRSSRAEPHLPKSGFAARRSLLLGFDDCSATGIAVWGIETRDPTADRDLIEFSFSLPSEILASGEASRPLYAAAFSDRLPDEVLNPTERGLQTADWDETFTQERVTEDFQKSSKHPAVSRLIDISRVQQILDEWPRNGWRDREQALFYRNDVLRIVSLANFIRVNF